MKNMFQNAFQALYGFIKRSRTTTDVQGLIENNQVKNLSTGINCNTSNLGIQLRTTFQGYKPDGCSFKVEINPKNLFGKKEAVKTVLISSKTNYVLNSFKSLPWLLPCCSLIFVVSSLKWAYRHVDADHCGIVIPKISSSNPFRNKLIQNTSRGKPCINYFLPTQYMNKQFKDNFLEECGKSIHPDFKNLLYEQKEVEKVLIFDDFRYYQNCLSICLTLSLTVLSFSVVTPWVRAMTVETVKTVFQKELGKSYVIQILLIHYSVSVTQVFVKWMGLLGFVLVVINLQVLFWIQKRVLTMIAFTSPLFAKQIRENKEAQ